MPGTRQALSGLLAGAVFAALVDAPAAAQTASLTLARLETNATSQPLGIDDRAPRFSWILWSERRG